MRAARCHSHGPLTNIVVEDIPSPEVGPGQILVQVEAAAVNFSDVLIVANTYQVSAPVPFTPGSEFAGTVTDVAGDVRRIRPGDRVCGSVFVGAVAEQVVANEAGVWLLPPGVDGREAAAFGVAYTTAYNALRSVAEVAPGETVVVLGAAGGVGLAAVELANRLGAHVVAAASSAEKLETCRQKGADGLINYETEDLKERIRALSPAGGADVVIDPVGGRHAEAAIRSCRWGARYVCLGFASGEIPRIPMNLVLLKGVSLQGFEFLGFAVHAPDEMQRNRQEVLELFATGQLHPHISGVYPLEQAAAAMQCVADRKSTGKVLITPSG
jgi:NADPH:quinone reductase